MGDGLMLWGLGGREGEGSLLVVSKGVGGW